MASLPSFAAVVVAAGQGLRAGQAVPKQFAAWRGKPLVRHSVQTLADLGAAPIVVAIPAGAEALARDALSGIPAITLVTGGAKRQESVARCLVALAEMAPNLVLIHDAARPDVPRVVVERLLAALAESPGAIPALPVIDSLAIDGGGYMAAAASRESVCRVQTPQAFRFAEILAAHRACASELDAGDDAQVAIAASLNVALVEGDERLHKLTFAGDFLSPGSMIRIGTGFDVHRMAEGEELWLCGIRIPSQRGLAGHSDADVALHAVVDAILGACALGDIGEHFPPSDPQWKGAASGQFIAHAVLLAENAGYRVGNVDLTLVCEEPKIGPHREVMRQKLADLLVVELSQVSVKATTSEGLGFTGRGEGIAAQAVVTMQLQEKTNQ